MQRWRGYVPAPDVRCFGALAKANQDDEEACQLLYHDVVKGVIAHRAPRCRLMIHLL